MQDTTDAAPSAPRTGASRWDTGDVESLIAELSMIRADLLALEARYGEEFSLVHGGQRASARNLVHYMALRSHDLRHVQERLARLGLSSLGRSEAYVLDTVDAVLSILHQLVGSHWQPPAEQMPPLSIRSGRALLERNARGLLKDAPRARSVRIMVTMPSEAATDYDLVRDLLAAGMDIMRINCAHDSRVEWTGMIANLRRAEAEIGREGHVLMDLAGPKLRTGPMAPGPKVVKWRPQRDELGRTTAPARIWLTTSENPRPAPEPADAVLPVSARWLKHLHAGDEITLRDARHSRRSLRVLPAGEDGWWAECGDTAYVTPGTRLQLRARDGRASARTTIGDLPAQMQPILLQVGDTLILTRELKAGCPAIRDAQGLLIASATISCTLPAVFTDVRNGERVWLDDGKIGGTIRSATADQLDVEITQAFGKGEKLRADKGINLPDSTLRLPALTEQDLQNLPFVVEHADLVGYSFVHSPQDIAALRAQLAELGGQSLGIVLKIETRAAFEALPSLLLAAMSSPFTGVMIARGDLAVECGYERMAEVQEEILCIAEAAHMPVIWATQVLENLAQEGVPSRAEISDAAMGERAECVMLNKGPFIVEAVRVLDNILKRMEGFQTKKSSMLRRLRVSRNFQPAKKKAARVVAGE